MKSWWIEAGEDIEVGVGCRKRARAGDGGVERFGRKGWGEDERAIDLPCH